MWKQFHHVRLLYLERTIWFHVISWKGHVHRVLLHIWVLGHTQGDTLLTCYNVRERSLRYFSDTLLYFIYIYSIIFLLPTDCSDRGFFVPSSIFDTRDLLDEVLSSQHVPCCTFFLSTSHCQQRLCVYVTHWWGILLLLGTDVTNFEGIMQRFCEKERVTDMGRTMEPPTTTHPSFSLRWTAA